MEDVSSANLAMYSQKFSTLWHKHYGHLHYQGLKTLYNEELVTSLPNVSSSNICEGCIYGKQVRHSFARTGVKRSTAALDIVYADFCGPMYEESLDGSLYFFLLVDDHTRYNWVYFIKHKS